MSEHTGGPALFASFVVTADDLVAISRMTERDAIPAIHVTSAVTLVGGIYLAVTWNPTAGALLIGVAIALGILRCDLWTSRDGLVTRENFYWKTVEP